MKRRLGVVPAFATAALLLLSSCASDGDESSSTPSDSGSSATADSASPPSSEQEIAPTTTSSVTSDSDAAEPPPASTPVATEPPGTTVPGVLVEPSAELFEIGEFESPVDIVARPDDDRLFVLEQGGRVRAVDDESDEVVLDISELVTTDGSEQGLLGLAFHPSADLAYVDYTDVSGDTVVAEYAVDPATGVIDPSSARQVFTVGQPFPNHNGGNVVFGTDGLLYIGLGDGGAGGDPDRNGLDLSTPLGKILRIDPAASGTDSYTVPADNPFVGVDGADGRIWALGLRNPWRFSFDSANGDLWIADVGQNEFEEIDHVPATGGLGAGRGLSFGWSAFEGDARFNDDQSPDGHTPPVYVYSHADGGCSVSGGAVARDTTVPNLSGWYVFGDYCSGDIWAFDPSSAGDAPRVVTLANLPALAAISIGADGELYAISNEGSIARLETP